MRLASQRGLARRLRTAISPSPVLELLGTDVNLIHRLSKNHVAQSTGWKGYALFTHQGLERMQTDKASFVQQRESYEHLGDVETYVRDMHIRYQEMKAS